MPSKPFILVFSSSTNEKSKDCQGGLEAYRMWGSFGEEGESD
ncbi:hypothetical protein Tco_0957357, partial [Tanacetum coccineum]